MADLFIEIACEEIPARMQQSGIESLQNRLKELLEDARLTHSSTTLAGVVTPRRLGLCVTDVRKIQEAATTRQNGPPVTAPEKAVSGFFRKMGLESLVTPAFIEAFDGSPYRFEDKQGSGVISHQSNGGKTVWHVEKTVPANEAVALLPEIINRLIKEHVWPKSMRFAAQDIRWVRPITGICAIFDQAPLAGTLVLSEEDSLTFSDQVQGHRFLNPEFFTVTDFEQYKQELKNRSVLVDQTVRKATIHQALTQAAAKKGYGLREDPVLLEEVTGLVEFPNVLIGTIDPGYMQLPPEVIRLTMRSHQKYFALIDKKKADKDNNLAPAFAFIANNDPADGGAAVIAGNERVLRARLADAAFFFAQDSANGLDHFAPKLAPMIFHKKLGSMADRATRLTRLVEYCAQALNLSPADTKAAIRAASLCKNDLASGMVGEFPELQGYMGGHYATLSGETDTVAAAISTHYAPRGPGESCPQAPVSIALCLADKLDILAGFWLIDETPTGSKDPFALRRAALGVIRLLSENALNIALTDDNQTGLLHQAAQGYGLNDPEMDKKIAALDVFFDDRFRQYLRDKNYPHDQINAVLAAPSGRFAVDTARLDIFLSQAETVAKLQAAYRRVHNILQAEAGDQPLSDLVPDLLHLPEEKDLFAKASKLSGAPLPFKDQKDLGKALYEKELLACQTLTPVLDEFFDKVTVNDPDNPDLRRNRLALLDFTARRFRKLADFSQLAGL